MISAFVGVSIKKCFGNNDLMWLQAPLAVSISIFFMNLTKTLHPPGSATSLIAVMPNTTIQNLGFMFVLIPIGSGAAIMILIALIFNNIFKSRTYPKFWI
jgi:CBS-domain-containing membrane protein